MLYHVRQEERREHLGDRTNLKDCIAIDIRAALASFAVSNDPRAVGVDDADDNSRRALLITHQVGKVAFDFSILHWGFERRRQWKTTKHRRDNDAVNKPH